MAGGARWAHQPHRGGEGPVMSENGHEAGETKIGEILGLCRILGASDIHLVAAKKPHMRRLGQLEEVPGSSPLSPTELRFFEQQIFDSPHLELHPSRADCAYVHPDVGRFRVHRYCVGGVVALSLRTVSENLFTLTQLGLPKSVERIFDARSGLVLISGATGAGKSTTLAALIHAMSERRRLHIMTIEDPIEFIHKPGRSLLTQRELGKDCESVKSALTQALREDPDVVVVGELRGATEIEAALSVAESGHLVLATVHGESVASALERVVNSFSPPEREQIARQLGSCIFCVLSQDLVLRADQKGMVAVVEVGYGTPAFRHLVRSGAFHQLDALLQSGGSETMVTKERAYAALKRDGQIPSTAPMNSPEKPIQTEAPTAPPEKNSRRYLGARRRSTRSIFSA